MFFYLLYKYTKVEAPENDAEVDEDEVPGQPDKPDQQKSVATENLSNRKGIPKKPKKTQKLTTKSRCYSKTARKEC